METLILLVHPGAFRPPRSAEIDNRARSTQTLHRRVLGLQGDRKKIDFVRRQLQPDSPCNG